MSGVFRGCDTCMAGMVASVYFCGMVVMEEVVSQMGWKVGWREGSV